MNQRQLIWLGGALIVLLIVAYLTGVFDTDFSTVDVPELTISAQEVRTIHVTGQGQNVGLERDNGTWMLTEPLRSAADSVTVSRFLEDLSALELQSVVSTNSERHARYGVDSMATEVRVEGEGGEQSLIVGDQGPGFGSNYVRISGEEPVYLSSGSIRIPENADAWRDKTIVRLSPNQISRLSISGPGLSYDMVREDGSWGITDHTGIEGESPPASVGGRSMADSAATAQYLRRFDPLRADGFLASPPPAGDSTYTIRLTVDSARERVLELVPANNGHALTVDEGETVYRLQEYRLRELAPAVGYFVGE